MREEKEDLLQGFEWEQVQVQEGCWCRLARTVTRPVPQAAGRQQALAATRGAL